MRGASGAVGPCVEALMRRARLLYAADAFAKALQAAGLDRAAGDPDFAEDSVAGIAHLFAPGPDSDDLWDRSLLRELKALGMTARIGWA